jgi:hypothetical protein
MRARKVWGLMPSSAAAPRGPSMRPFVNSRARSMWRAMAALSGSGGAVSVPTWKVTRASSWRACVRPGRTTGARPEEQRRREYPGGSDTHPLPGARPGQRRSSVRAAAESPGVPGRRQALAHLHEDRPDAVVRVPIPVPPCTAEQTRVMLALAERHPASPAHTNACPSSPGGTTDPSARSALGITSAVRRGIPATGWLTSSGTSM